MYEFDKPDHFKWKWIDHNFGLHLGALSEEMKKMFGNMNLPTSLTREMNYNFDLDEKGKVVRMYNDKYEKIFGKKKQWNGHS